MLHRNYKKERKRLVYEEICVFKEWKTAIKLCSGGDNGMYAYADCRWGESVRG